MSALKVEASVNIIYSELRHASYLAKNEQKSFFFQLLYESHYFHHHDHKTSFIIWLFQSLGFK